MDAREKKVKTDAGYVQVEGFADAHQGYFCGTCKNLKYIDGELDIGATGGDGRDGYCLGLKVPVRTYACCDHWQLAADSKVRGADGVRLRVIR